MNHEAVQAGSLAHPSQTGVRGRLCQPKHPPLLSLLLPRQEAQLRPSAQAGLPEGRRQREVARSQAMHEHPGDRSGSFWDDLKPWSGG